LFLILKAQCFKYTIAPPPRNKQLVSLSIEGSNGILLGVKHVASLPAVDGEDEMEASLECM